MYKKFALTHAGIMLLMMAAPKKTVVMPGKWDGVLSFTGERNGEGKSIYGTDTDNYAVGYVISKSLSGDFLSVFNLVQDIAKIPKEMRSKHLLATTTTERSVPHGIQYERSDSYANAISKAKLDSELANVDYILNSMNDLFDFNVNEEKTQSRAYVPSKIQKFDGPSSTFSGPLQHSTE